MRLFAGLAVRPVYARVKVDPSIIDADKIRLGVRRINQARVRIHAPDSRPSLRVQAMVAGTLTLAVINNEPGTSNAKPRGATALVLFRHEGNANAGPISEGRYVGTYTRTPISIPLTPADDLKHATFVARWISRKGEAGPPSDPLTLRLDCQFVGVRRGIAA